MRPPATAATIRLLVLDVDGVLTDGRLYFGARGETIKVFHVRDGYGIRAVMAAGISVAVITGRRSRALTARCRELGIAHVMQGQNDKLAALERLCTRLRIGLRECACVGDDVVDVPLFAVVGLSFAVADAHPAARRAAHRITRLPGGAGAVRELCDLLITARTRRRRER
jgi:3-deoxy-D-manno-octulosonate 8-phosphate phosphatase (KDO 8-P phosphatase)